MLTAGMNALAMARLGGIRLMYGGGRDGITLFLFGLSSMGAAIWALTHAGPKGPTKD